MKDQSGIDGWDYMVGREPHEGVEECGHEKDGHFLAGFAFHRAMRVKIAHHGALCNLRSQTVSRFISEEENNIRSNVKRATGEGTNLLSHSLCPCPLVFQSWSCCR